VRRRRSFLGTDAKISFAEHDRGEIVHILDSQRTPAGKSHFNRKAGRQMQTAQTGRYRGRVVGDDQITRA